MAALIGALRVSLSADTANFETGMRRAQRQSAASASGIQKSLGVIKAGIAGLVSGLSLGLFVNIAKNALEYAGSLGEVAQQLGVTTTQLQVYRYAASQAGVSQEQMDKGLAKLNVSLGQAASGAKAPKAAFDELSRIIGKDIVASSKQGGDALPLVADGLAKITDRSKRAAIETALFSRAGSQLDTVLSGGSAGLNAYAQAASRLGIVLSEDQIANADRTADKIEDLTTALKANIAGAVANNANSIYSLVDALIALISKLPTAIRAYQAFVAKMEVLGGKLQAFDPTNSSAGQAEGRLRIAAGEATLRDLQNQQRGGSSAESRVARFRRGLGMGGAPAPKVGADVGQFLGGGGGGGKAKRSRAPREDHSAERALSDAFRFDEDIRRSNIDILNAKRDLATDAVERYKISIDTKDAEREGYAAQLAYQVKLNELSKGQDGITAAQAAQLQAQYDIKDGLERQKLIADEEHRAFEEGVTLDGVTLELQRDALAAEAQNADTAKEQRRVQLRILDLNYQIERARLEAVLADKQSSDAAKEEARRRLEALNHTYGPDRQAVINNTRSPLEELSASLPTDADKMNEALENVAANGLKSLEDGLMDVITGTKSVKEAFHQLAASILADLLRIAIQKYIIGTIMQVAGLGAKDGGLVPGFAYGGFVSGPGGPRDDRVPAMLSNGEFVINAKATKKFLPILEKINAGDVAMRAAGGLAVPRSSVSAMNLANDDAPMSERTPVHQTFDLRGAVMTEDLLRQMKAMSDQAAQEGARMGADRVFDINERTFGRALRR